MKNKTAIYTSVFIIGSLLAGYVMFIAGKEVYRGKKIEQEIEKLKAEADKINSNNTELKEKIAYLDTDQFREKIAKEKLNLRKDGERVIEVHSSFDENSEISGFQEKTQENQEIIEKKIYEKWWGIFFSN